MRNVAIALPIRETLNIDVKSNLVAEINAAHEATCQAASDALEHARRCGEISYRPLRGRFDEGPLEGACGKLSSSCSCFFSSGSFRQTYSRMPSSATPTMLTPYQRQHGS